MAFAAARMIKEKEARQNQGGNHSEKKTTDIIHSHSRSTNLKRSVQSSRSQSICSFRSGSSVFSSGKARTRTGHDKNQIGRTGVKCVKRKPNRSGGPDKVDLLVLIDLSEHKLIESQVSEYKEVFMLFDKDQDGVLSFNECSTAIRTLGLRHSEKTLLKMVRSVSEDKLYDTIEFNEFLQMMGRHQENEINLDTLMEAFETFDKDNDGFLTTDEMRKIMKGRMSKKDLDSMIKEADGDNDGFINCKEFCMVLCTDLNLNEKQPNRSKKGNLSKIKDEGNDSRSGSTKTLSQG